MEAGLVHPLRGEILRTLESHGRGSATSVARLLGVKVRLASYHMEVLRKPPCNAIEFVSEQKVGRADERFYRLREDLQLAPIEWPAIPKPMRRVSTLTVDAQGQKEIGAEIRECAERIEILKGQSAERLAKSPGAEAIRTAVGMSAFEIPPQASSPDEGSPC
jgi:predicted ArsR family transcriptional regulator